MQLRAGSVPRRPTVTVGTRSPSGEAAVFVLRAGPEARRSLSTTPDDCPSRRHAISRRTLGGARLAEVRWNRAAYRLRTRIRTVFGIDPGHRHGRKAHSGPELAKRCSSDEDVHSHSIRWNAARWWIDDQRAGSAERCRRLRTRKRDVAGSVVPLVDGVVDTGTE